MCFTGLETDLAKDNYFNSKVHTPYNILFDELTLEQDVYKPGNVKTVNINNNQNVKHNKIMEMVKNSENIRMSLNQRRIDPNIMNIIQEKVNKTEVEREKMKEEKEKLDEKKMNIPELSEIKNNNKD